MSVSRILLRPLVAGLVGLLVATSWAVPPASAADLDAPRIVTPTEGEAVTGIPRLTWERVGRATSYDVQVSASPDMSGPLVDVTTTNVTYVPVVQLPADTELHWQVRARSGSVPGDWSRASFRRDRLDVPAPQSPTNGSLLEPPAALTLTWTPVAGATAYEVQLGTDDRFTDPTLYSSKTVKGTSYAETVQRPPGTYYWRVRAQLGPGTTTRWSSDASASPWKFHVQPLEPVTLVSPDHDPAGASPLSEVVLDWLPVDGAATYDLQVSTDQNFQDAPTITRTVREIRATRYSPPATFGNDQYYWRVRPVDLAGNAPSWGGDQVVHQFRRNWPEQPRPVYPEPGSVVRGPLFFEWTPVELASHYELQLSTRDTFPSDSRFTATCTTTQTTYTSASAPSPRSGATCMPTAGGHYYWRVLAYDRTPGSTSVVTQAIHAQVGEFSYAPPTARLLSPEDGAEVAVPTLRWAPLPEVARYEVEITAVVDGSTVASATTAATSFTPRTRLEPGAYRWSVTALTQDGRRGTTVLPAHQSVFTVSAAAGAPPTATVPTPTSTDTTTTRFPTLTWTPVVDATRYVVRLRRAGAITWSASTIATANPATEDWSDQFLVPGGYEFQVEAYQGSTLLRQGGIGRFAIAALTPVAGHRAALVGTDLDDPDASCAATVPKACENLRQSPVLAWDSVAGAASYLLYVSRDAEMTNPVYSQPRVVFGTTWAPTAAFADSNAGSAYFWQVVPCTSPGTCAPQGQARHQFNQLSNEVALVSPADGEELEDDVALDWKDYLTFPGDSPGTSSLPDEARTEAAYYRVQVATSPQFTASTVLDEQLVDQTTFTSYRTTYPEGPIYWRVQAYDGSLNALSWSQTRSFVKRSPTPTLVSPAPGGRLDTAQTFAWAALPFAASYQVEVYRDDDTVPSAGNRVLSATTKQTSYTSPTTLLPVAATSYRWRVRRLDADNRVGAWSRLEPFTVSGSGPEQTSPVEGVRLHPNGVVLTWDPVVGAGTYRVERRAVGTTTLVEKPVTAATAWAPTSTVAGGRWEWRIVALDAAGSPLGASGWRSFTVVARPSVTAAPVVTGTGKVGTALTSTTPAWDLDDVTTGFQWYRGSTPIPGATGDVYQLSPADVGKSVRMRVTGSLAGYPDGTADSNSVDVGPGEGPSLARDLLLTGSSEVGGVLVGTPEWAQPDVSTTYQWLLDGTRISNARAGSLTVLASYAGRTLRLEATGTRAGYTPVTVASNIVTATSNEQLVASTSPRISGAPTVGSRLTVTAGTWKPSSAQAPTLTHQWLRDGAPVTGATGATYVLTAADAGRLVTARVTASRPGFRDGQSTADPVRIAKASTRTTLTMASRSLRRTSTPRATVVVSAPAGIARSGSVTVYDGSRRLRTVTLAAAAGGRVTLTLPRLTKGVHQVSAVYAGNGQLASSRSSRTVVRVR